MRLLEQVQHGKQVLPRRTMLYGTHGIGKSTFGSMAERPIFIQTEDGLANIDCPRFPLAECYEDVKQALVELFTEPHDYGTVVLDSLDWLERLIFQKVCDQHGVDSIEKIGYQKGYTFALTPWREVLAGLDALRRKRGMAIVLLAHARIETFQNPETDPYDRYSPRLHKHGSALIQEWCDEVLFATYRVDTKLVDAGFDRKRARPIGDGGRVIRTTERPAHMAKNRLNLPEELPLDYRVYAAHVRGEVIAAPAEVPSNDAESVADPAPATVNSTATTTDSPETETH